MSQDNIRQSWHQHLKEAENILRGNHLGLSNALYSKTGDHLIRSASSLSNEEVLELLIIFGECADLKRSSRKRGTLIDTAWELGLFNIVCALIEYGWVVENNDKILCIKKGRKSLFRRALKDQRVDVIKALARRGMNLKGPISSRYDDYSFFHYICENGNIEMVKFCISEINVDVNYTIGGGPKPILSAAKGGKADIIQLLIDNGAEVDYSFHDKGNIGTAIYYENANCLEVLLKNGAKTSDYTVHDSSKIPMLHFAAICGNKAAIELLLKYGEDINKIDEEGNTALYQCISKDCFKYLILREIDVNKKNNSNYTAIEFLKALNEYDNLYFNNNAYEQLKQSFETCPSEVQKLKTISLNNKNSMHDFLLFKSNRKLSQYANNIALNRIFQKTPNFTRQFPNYGIDISIQFLKSLARKELVEIAARYLKGLSGINIPELCCLELFDLFTNAEITKFIPDENYLFQDKRIYLLLERQKDNELDLVYQQLIKR